MTAFDGFDLVDARVAGAIDEIAAASRPDYLDDIFKVTAQTRQRPRWTFFERWLPMDTAAVRHSGRVRVSLRPILLLVIVALLAVLGAAILAGAQRRVPPPFGPAVNGQIAYGSGGDLYVRDSLTGAPRLLVGGPGEQGGAAFSLDGQLVAYDNLVNNVDLVTVANADGSRPRQVFDEPFNGTASWSPDSRSLVLTNTSPNGGRTMWIVAADGSGAMEITPVGIAPYDAIFNPANDGTILMRGDALLGRTNLYLVDRTGQVIRNYDLPGNMVYGADWELAGPAFSPDGKTIAHNSVEEGPGGVRFRTYLVNADGTNNRLLPEPVGAPGNYSQAWPMFSPDGKWILMESWVGLPGGPATNQIAIAPADGSAPAHGIGPSITNQSLNKVWSPDGTKVLIAAQSINAVYQADPDTGETTKLDWNSDLPDWQRAAR